MFTFKMYWVKESEERVEESQTSVETIRKEAKKNKR